MSLQSMQMETLGRPSAAIRDGSILIPQHSGSIVSAQPRSGKRNMNLVRIMLAQDSDGAVLPMRKRDKFFLLLRDPRFVAMFIYAVLQSSPLSYLQSKLACSAWLTLIQADCVLI